MAFKWLPVFSSYCAGCGSCVDACPRSCIGLVWDFATLQRPADCSSGGACAAVCPQEKAVRMAWVKMDGDQTVGRWCDAPAPPQAPDRRAGWYGRLARHLTSQTLADSGSAAEPADPP